MEAAVGLIGAAATVGAAQLTAASGFTGRHESSHREERMETKRNRNDFMENLKSGEVTQEEEVQFLKILDETTRRENAYHESIESYKKTSWVKFVPKVKKRMKVRKAKRLTRQSNHSLRSLNGSMYSGSDASSICASAGSPPGSNLAVDDIRDWTYDTANAQAFDGDRVGREQIRARRKRLVRRVSLPARLNTSQPLVDSVEDVGARRQLSLERDFRREPVPHVVDNGPVRDPRRLYRTKQPLERDFNRNRFHMSPSSRASDFASLMRSMRQEPSTQPPELNAQPELNAPPVNRLRKGMWNRRGDHLTPDGFIVYAPAPADRAYPAELSDYPHEMVGYRDHTGATTRYIEWLPELPESLPRFGQPPRRPYETFLEYVDEATGDSAFNPYKRIPKPPSGTCSDASASSSRETRLNEHLAVLLPRQLWKPDRLAAHCDNFYCRVPFSVFVRRHHCRKCGGVFCAPCTSRSTPLLDTSNLAFLHPPRNTPLEQFASPTSPLLPARVCDDCFDQIHGLPCHTPDVVPSRAPSISASPAPSLTDLSG